MMRDRWRVALLLVSTLALLGGLRNDASAQHPQSVDSTAVAENRELDRQLLEAHERKDPDMVLSLFSKSPDTFFITPSGTVIKGLGGMRESFVRFFASLRSIH